MKEAFVAFDAEEFGEMNCKTCHGAGAEDGSFEMPNPELDKLDFDEDGSSSTRSTRRSPSGWARWSTPKMAELLGMPVYDPATHKGFGCLGCHTMATTK
jgi:mono/diheme cytochrome c family protein